MFYTFVLPFVAIVGGCCAVMGGAFWALSRHYKKQFEQCRALMILMCGSPNSTDGEGWFIRDHNGTKHSLVTLYLSKSKAATDCFGMVTITRTYVTPSGGYTNETHSVRLHFGIGFDPYTQLMNLMEWT